ncbi:MAG TPA: hypothetical protein ACFCUC_10885, partial [Desulfobacterales bacterium]
ERERALVVSSDRSIVRSASASRAAIIDASEFEHSLQLAAASGSAMEDTDSGGGGAATREKGPARRLPKRRRRNRTKIRKL